MKQKLCNFKDSEWKLIDKWAKKHCRSDSTGQPNTMSAIRQMIARADKEENEKPNQSA